MATILVPLDTSEIAPTVLLEAESFALKLQAKIILFHVVEPIATYVPVGAAMDLIATSPPELDDEQTDVAQKRLEQLAGPLRAKGLDVACEACFGLPVDEIVDQAKARGVDYILLGSHGHGALFHLFGGSVVTGVLKQSSCPVVVVPVHKQTGFQLLNRNAPQGFHPNMVWAVPENDSKKITLALENVPGSAVLEYAAKLAGLKVSYEEFAVRILPE